MKHRLKFDCKRDNLSEEQKLDAEISEHIAKHKKIKEEKQKAKKPWININTKSVKLHVLDKCPNRLGNVKS